MARGSGLSLSIGGSPRVNLLPPAFRAARKDRKVRRRWGAGIAATVVMLLLLAVTANIAAVRSEALLSSARNTGETLVNAQVEYAAEVDLQTDLDAHEHVETVVRAADINWAQYIGEVSALLPAGATIRNVTVDSTSPLADFPQPSIPLEEPRVATLAISASAGSLADISGWVAALRALDGFADCAIESITGADGAYQTIVVLHLDSGAFTVQPRRGN
ncbi:MAG: hypothetical protein H7146_07135 [Burkholderiaceae bacterium]|nr:hypothetical protein [Microbacteriaceae bacterium]